jgi:hypothetical protein
MPRPMALSLETLHKLHAGFLVQLGYSDAHYDVESRQHRLTADVLCEMLDGAERFGIAVNIGRLALKPEVDDNGVFVVLLALGEFDREGVQWHQVAHLRVYEDLFVGDEWSELQRVAAETGGLSVKVPDTPASITD